MLDTLHSTLVSAAAAFGSGWAKRLPAGSDALRCRVIGNGLRELDRFLNLLIDEAVRLSGGAPALNRHNTANKLIQLRPAFQGDHHRLRALGRSRACLFYCGGMVDRGDVAGSQELTIGWCEDGGQRLRRVRVGERMELAAEDLKEAGRYYAALGNAVAGAVATR